MTPILGSVMYPTMAAASTATPSIASTVVTSPRVTAPSISSWELVELCRVQYVRQLLGSHFFCSVPIIARHGRREGDEPVFGQATYISIYKVSKLLVSTPIFLSLLP